ncbi:MAG: glycosyltransferase family 4 protein [Eubacteriales bacterium]|nr:glycosyltransferase family 4 protein [Eubacteriales bacterium]
MSDLHQNCTVLHLTDYGAPYEGNFIASLRALERRLADDGIPMIYVFPKRAGDMPWAQTMRREKQNVFLIERNGFFAYARQIRRLLRQYDVSILHAHFIHYKEKLAALFAAKTCGHRVETVLHLHNHLVLPKSRLRSLPQRLYLSFVSRFVCCSKSVADRLVSDGIPPIRVLVAENAIAFERLSAFEPLDRSSLGISRDEKIALMFGFDFLRKGVDLAVEAVRSLREAGEPVSLAIVLSSRKEEVEAAILHQLGAAELPGWIRLLPARSDVAAYYHMADVFLSPSREEGFCYALVEAVSCRTPVLASAIDAQRDLALPQDAFVPPQDAAALSNAIPRVLQKADTPEQKSALEQAGRRVVETYALNAWAERVARIYLEILS